MLETGNWLVPYLGSEPYLRKPPLINWVIAGSFKLTGVRNEWTARLMREFVVTQVLRRAVAELNIDEKEAPVRTALVATQIGGLAMIRYVLKVEPIASSPAEPLVAAIGPAVQRYLTGELPGVFEI